MKHEKNHEPTLEIMRWAYLGLGFCLVLGWFFGIVCLFVGVFCFCLFDSLWVVGFFSHLFRNNTHSLCSAPVL